MKAKYFFVLTVGFSFALAAVVSADSLPLHKAQGTARKVVYSGAAKFAYGFSDNMVLQRDTTMNVWGFADPGTDVTVSIDTQNVSATADRHGKWLLRLAPMTAGGPYSLTLNSGQTTQKLTNVLVGDVWICSGQSNMRYGLSRQDKGGNYLFQHELTALQKQSAFPIRHFMKDDENTPWFEVNYEAVTNTLI